ncbi:MAG: hypothetical protein ABI837_20795 [Acidobacteriota bacterium]
MTIGIRVAKGQYVPDGPVFVIADDQSALTFTVAVGVRGATSEAAQLTRHSSIGFAVPVTMS